MLSTTDPDRPTRCRRPVLRRRDRGLSTALFALMLTSVLIVTGLVVDLGAWQVEASDIQQAADASALAGVVRLPDGDAAAVARALEVAAENGYVHGVDGVSVMPRVIDSSTLEVTITTAQTDQFFTQIVRSAPSVSRRSTSQYVQPVALGSPRNYLGTGNLLQGVAAGDGVENFWLSMSGTCTRREFGDRIAVRTMAIDTAGGYSCENGVDGQLPNPEYSPDGYVFGVTVPPSATVLPAIEMFDAPVCAFAGSRAGDENNAAFDVRVRVRLGDDLDPLAGTVVSDTTFVGGDDPGLGDCGDGNPSNLNPLYVVCPPDQAFSSECWRTLYTPSAPGTYYVQVNPVDSGLRNLDSRHDDFSLRARTTAANAFTPCTSDSTVPFSANPAYDPSCTQVFGLEHLPVFAFSTAVPVFFLASIDEKHNGKTMQVTLYDAGEGATFIELLDPTGTPAFFDWEVLCADASDPGPSGCAGENDPTGGRSGGPTNKHSVSGTGTKTFANNFQNGKYSDRLLRLTVELPDDIKAAWGDRTWWKIRYSGSFSGDRTTWSVTLLGDAVRLVPNSNAPVSVPASP